MYYYRIDTPVEDNTGDIGSFADSSYTDWEEDFNQLLYKNNLFDDIKVDDWLINLEYYHGSAFLSCVSTTIEDDAGVDEFLKNIHLQKKLEEAAKDHIRDINEKIKKLNSINYIPDEPFMYKNGYYYIEVSPNSKYDPRIDWKVAEFNPDIEIDWEAF